MAIDLAGPGWVLAQVVTGILLLGTGLHFASRLEPALRARLAQLGVVAACIVVVALRIAVERVPYLPFGPALIVGAQLTIPPYLVHLVLARAIREPTLGFYLVIMTVSSLVSLVLLFIAGLAFFAGT